MTEKKNNDGFLLVILGSAAAAGILYLVQEQWVDPWLSSRWGSALFRAFRMSIVYVIPAIWWLRRNNKKQIFAEMGLILPRERAPFILGTGILLYCFALLAFLLWPPLSCGFIFWSGDAACRAPQLTDWLVVLPLICIMAMITDLWTRGFVLLQAAERWGEPKAIALQNALWLLLHLYELELLAPSMGWAGALLLAVFLGIVGDLLALKERSVVGLMAGHAILNIGWVLSLATWFNP